MVELTMSQATRRPIDMIQEVKFVPEAQPSADRKIMDSFQIDRAIDAWEQVGELASQISSSVMAKQASLISQQFREETDFLERPTKRMKLRGRAAMESEVKPSIVISDEEDSNASQDPISPGLSQQIDRLAKMSRLILEIDHCHKLLKTEMLAMAEQGQETLDG